jgi:hypothetical protein
MSSYTINVLSDTDDKFVLDLLQALETKGIINFEVLNVSIEPPRTYRTNKEIESIDI